MEQQMNKRVQEYWNTRAEGYSLDVQAELSGESGKKWLNLAKEHLPEEKFTKGLDIGCGPGFFCALFGSAGYRMTGIDCTEGMLSEAEKNIRDAGTKASLLRMDAETPDFPEKSFDFIVSRNLIWNLPHPEKAYENWVKLLREKGRMLIMDGNYYLHYALPAYDTHTPGSNHQHMEGVDVSVINNLAKELPLSFQLRPEWDLKVLEKLGCTVKILDEQKETGADGSEIIRSFILLVEKV